jgi:hypothetical protein
MESNQSYPIHRSWILSTFLIVPLLVGIFVFDVWFQDQAWQKYFSLATLFLPLYLLIFELPHIIASVIGFFDREYLQSYRKTLFLWLPLIFMGLGFLIWYNFILAVLVYLVATMYHVIRQQTGIALMFTVPKGVWHAVWSWSLVIGGSLLFIEYARNFYSLAFGWPEYLIEVFFGISILAGFVLMRFVKVWSGIMYICMTSAMVLASYFFMAFAYPFLAVFVVRFVHDVTAFLFYITHEMNRNEDSIHNYLYQYLPLVPISLIVLVPLLAVFIGLVLRESVPDATTLFTIVIFLSFAHYVLESVMWKRDAPHRQHIFIK